MVSRRPWPQWRERLPVAAISLLALGPLAISFGLPAESVTRPSVAELLDHYEAGDYEFAVRQLASDPIAVGEFAGDLKRVSAAWISATDAANSGRRRLIVATIALEAARGLMPRNIQNLARPEEEQWPRRIELLEWSCRLLRQKPPLSAERWWHLAAMAFLEQAAHHPFYARSFRRDAIAHLSHASLRFSGEPRLRLAAAIVEEIAAGVLSYPLVLSRVGDGYNIVAIEAPGAELPVDVIFKTGVTGTYPVDRDYRANVRMAARGLGALLGDSNVGAEAHLRLGAIELYLNQPALALPHFEMAERSQDDPFVVYLAKFFKAATLTRLTRPDLAESAFQEALAIVPHAESSSIGLAWLLFVTHRPASASNVIRESLAEPSDQSDPFLLFSAGDGRLWPTFVRRLREGLK